MNNIARILKPSDGNTLDGIRRDLDAVLAGRALARVRAARAAVAEAKAEQAKTRELLLAAVQLSEANHRLAEYRDAVEAAEAAAEEAARTTTARRIAARAAAEEYRPAILGALATPLGELEEIILGRLSELETIIDPLGEVMATLLAEGVEPPRQALAVAQLSDAIRAARLALRGR